MRHQSIAGRALPADEAPDFDAEPGAGKRLGKVGRQDWRAWQLQKEGLAQGYEAIGQAEHALALRNCCHRLVVHRYEHATVVVGRAEYRDLLCPTGMRARSRALQAHAVTAIENLCGERPGLQGLFVTLTIKNCASHELKATVGGIISCYSRLMRRAPVQRAAQAWLRSVEVSRDRRVARAYACGVVCRAWAIFPAQQPAVHHATAAARGLAQGDAPGL